MSFHLVAMELSSSIECSKVVCAVADNVVATNEPDGHAPPPPLLYAYIVFFLQLLLPQFDLDQRRFWGVVMLFKSTTTITSLKLLPHLAAIQL